MLKYFILGIFSRVIIIAISKVSFIVFEPYDHSESLSSERSIFNCLLRWDSFHFLEISYRGYVSEHTTVFFPFLPLIVRFLGKLFRISHFTISVILNNLIFALTVPLFKIIASKLLNDNETLVNISSILFAFNPASVVFSTMYTETLFTFVLYISICQIIRGYKYKSIITFSLLGLIRSNFILYTPLIMLIYFPISCLSFILYQTYILSKYFRVTSDFSIFLPYSYFQSKYWDQGFLKFYNYKNILNLFMGLPIIFIAITVILYNYPGEGYSKTFLRIFILQIIILLLMIHINTAARFLSSNVILYSGISKIYIKNLSLFKKIIRIYFTYTFIYAILFGNYFPPA